MKKALALLLALALALPLTSCGQLGALKDLGNQLGGIADALSNFKSMDEIAGNLENFKIVIENTTSYGDKSTITEMRCKDGYMLETDGMIMFYDYGKKMSYMLNPDTKDGYSYKIDDDSDSQYFGMTSLYLAYHYLFALAGPKKGGTEKVSGRNCTYYTLTIEDGSIKFWVDDEIGITMKYITNDGESMEIKEFKNSGVKLSDMVNISQYNITDFSDY